MKKYLLFLSAGLLMTACSDDAPVPENGGEQQVTISFNLPETINSRDANGGSNSAKGGASNCTGEVTFTAALYYGESNDAVWTGNATATATGNASVSFKPTLVVGEKYKLVAYAQLDGLVSSLTEVNEPNAINDESVDAYFFTGELIAEPTMSATLKRATGKLRIIAEDFGEMERQLGKKVEKVTISYKQAQPTSFNPTTGKWAKEATETEFTESLAEYTEETGGAKTILVDYIPATTAGEIINIEKVVVTFEGGTTYEKDLSKLDIPVKRNYLTTLSGNFFTATSDLTLTLDDAFEGNYDIDANVGYKYDEETNTYHIYNATGYKWIADNAGEKNGYEGATILLANDLDLYETEGGERASIQPIGNSDGVAFKGVFDGQGHAIKNLYQSGWAFGYEWGSYGSIGLFSELESATVKNVVIEGMEAVVEGGDISFIAGSATGDCVFENIEVKNSTVGTYNNGCGGIIGWSGAGNYTFKNITIGEDAILAGLWGSFDSSIGGVVGQAEPGATYNLENVTINCRLDVYNDCTASYDYYNYRMCGMIIGRCAETTKIDGTNYPDMSKYNITCKNVTVNYGDWMNYHYCDPTPGLNGGRGMRVEPGYSYDGIPADYDHTQCTSHCKACIPFDQLFGGAQYGVTGIPAYEGVTVNYPYSFATEVSTAGELKSALESGKNVKLGTDIDYGTTQLAVTGVKVDLNGHTLTTQMAYGGIAMKNGASIKNGKIVHASTVAAIKAYDVEEIVDVVIESTNTKADKAVTGIAVQNGGKVGTIKNVTVTGFSQGIEVGSNASTSIGLIENSIVYGKTNGTAKGIALNVNCGNVAKAIGCTFEGDVYGVHMQLKGVNNVGLELANCDVTGATASIYAHDEEGIDNSVGSLTLTYDAETMLSGEFIWNFEEECNVTLNAPGK